MSIVPTYGEKVNPILSAKGNGIADNYANNITEAINNVNGQDHREKLVRVAAAARKNIKSPHKPAEQSRESLNDFLLSQGAHDEGNAQCVHYHHSGKFAYNDALGWLAFNGTHWIQDGAEPILDRAIVETLTARMRAVVDTGEMDKYAQIAKKSIPNAALVSGAKTLLKSLCFVQVSEFDKDPDRLNCLNGVVDLRTGDVEPHSPSQRFMHCINEEYHPDADQSVWVDWLVGAVGQESAAYLQLAMGYSLTGYTREEVLFYLYGPPRSGKGTFTETQMALLGAPLTKEVNFGTFTAARDGDSQSFDLAPLRPCHFVAASESKQYERLNEAQLKALTGGNEVYCAFKHRTHFSYRPAYKIWLSSNHPVNADPDDDAAWGRIRVVEFPNSNLDKEDKSLKQRMKSPEVLRGVLAWAVEGAKAWYRLGKAGLPELESGRRVKQQQRDELDNVQAWLDERCVKSTDSFVPNGMLYLSYSSWCKENGVEPKKQKGLSQSLKHKGYRDGSKWIEDGTKRGFSGFHLLQSTDKGKK